MKYIKENIYSKIIFFLRYANFATVSAAIIAAAFFAAPAGPAHAEKLPSGNISISIWDFPRIPHPLNPNDRFLWLREICDAYEKENPGVSITLTKLTWAQGGEKIKIAVFAGVPPDIASSDLPVKYIRQGLIEPVDAYLDDKDRSDYFKSALDAFTVSGKTYGFPWAQKTDFLYLNKKLFEKAGVELPAGGLWSRSEFINKMVKISNALNINAFSFCVEREQTSELPFLAGRGGSDVFEPSWDASGLQFTHDAVYKRKVSSPETGGLKSRDVWLGFKEKQNAACAPFGIWALPALQKDGKMSFDIAQYPYEDGNPSQARLSRSSVIGFYVFKQKDPLKLTHCIKLAKYITNAENQAILKFYGQFPTRRAVSSIFKDDPLMQKAFTLFERAGASLVHPEMPKMDEIVKSSVQKILLAGSLSTLEIEIEAAKIKAAISAIKTAYEAGEKSEKNSSSGASILKTTVFLCFFILAAAAAFFYKKLGIAAKEIVKNRHAYIYMLPALATFAIFFALPVARGILMSFQDFDFNTGIFDNLSGLKNYRAVFSDGVFRTAALNTAIYTAFVVPLNIIIALLLAVILHKLSERVQTLFKGAFYLPGVVSVVTLCIVWRYIFDFNGGILNLVIALFGFKPVRWLTSEEMSLFSIILFTVLKGPGGALLIYLTALCNIPKDYFEAAAVDGAGPVKTFIKITAPLLAPQTMFLAITLTIDSMQVFAPVMLLTEGGPANSSEVVIHRIYKEAFSNLDMGGASAMSVLLFFVILAASILQYKYFKYDYY